MKLDEVLRTALSRVDTVTVRTAVNPLLWLTGVTLPLCRGAAGLINDHSVRLALLGLAALPIGTTILAYFILLFRDPDRLQSEEYRIRQQALQILYTKGDAAEVVDVANQTPRIERSRPPRDRGDRK